MLIIIIITIIIISLKHQQHQRLSLLFSIESQLREFNHPSKEQMKREREQVGCYEMVHHSGTGGGCFYHLQAQRLQESVLLNQRVLPFFNSQQTN